MSFITRTASALALAILCASSAAPRAWRRRRWIRLEQNPDCSARSASISGSDRQIPLDLPFTDEAGQQVKLGQYFGKRPVILALVYYECPMLCTQVLNGLVSPSAS